MTCVKTPRGYHLHYRCEAAAGNVKLALEKPRQKQDADGNLLFKKGKPVMESPTKIETRGTGGYVVAPGSPKECHSLQKEYKYVAGPRFAQMKTITPEEREILFTVARTFDENEPAPEQGPATSTDRTGNRPGDQFNEEADFAEILDKKGWEHIKTEEGRDYWRRPGKEEGISAVTGLTSKDGNELFYCYSTSVPGIEAETTYTKFALYAALFHDGDQLAAARCLGQDGFGEQALTMPVLYGAKGGPTRDKAGTNGKAGPTRGKVPVPLPEVVMHGGSQRIVDTAEAFGKLVGDSGQVFTRGETFVRVPRTASGELHGIVNAAWGSEFELVADLRRVKVRQDQIELVPATCSVTAASQIVSAAAFREQVPKLEVLSPVPVLVRRGDSLELISGYDAETGTYALGDRPDEVPLDEARQLLLDLHSEFLFASPSDKSRAMAGLLAPAFVMGDLLGGRCPIDFGEAEQSQSGKGFRHKLTAAVYGSSVTTVVARGDGATIGGLEENFDTALSRGRAFVSLDNVRGKIDSPKIESFTTETFYNGRAPWGKGYEVDARRYSLMMTSNGAELTKDLANRCSCVAIRKQPLDHKFKEFPEGDLLAHVQANQSRYYGAVVAIVSEWHRQGEPKNHPGQHDFREWAGVMDWIVTELFDLPPLLDGHGETQERMTSPLLSWLRQLALLVTDEPDHEGAWYRASQLIEILEAADAPIPGVKPYQDIEDDEVMKVAMQAIGRKLSACFKRNGVECEDTGTLLIEIGRVQIRRDEIPDLQYNTSRVYQFQLIPDGDPAKTDDPAIALAGIGPSDPKTPTNGDGRDDLPAKSEGRPSYDPAKTQLSKTAVPAITANTPLKGNDFDIDSYISERMGPLSWIDGEDPPETPDEVIL